MSHPINFFIPFDNETQNISEIENRTLFLMSIHNPEIENFRLAYLTIGVTEAILITFGNAVVLLLFYQERATLKAPKNRFVISMAICDIITGLLFMPVTLYRFEARVSFSSESCPWVNGIMVTIYQTSMYVLSASSIDRYWAIVHPLNYHVNATGRRINAIILLSWAIPFSLGITHLLTHKTPIHPDLVCLMSNEIFNEVLIAILMISMAGNMITIVVLYILIHREVAKVFKARKEGFFSGALRILSSRESTEDENFDSNASNLNQKTIKNREIRSTLILLAIVTFALLAFLPGSINIITNTIKPDTFSMRTRLICYLLLTLNSILNPIFYAWNIKNIQDAAKILFRRVSFGRKNSIKPVV